MTEAPQWGAYRTAIDAVETFRWTDKPPAHPHETDLYDDLAVHPTDSLIHIRNELDRITKAARLAKAVVDARLVTRLQAGGHYYGDTLYVARKKRIRRVIDRSAYADWLADDYPLVIPIPISGGRITAVKEVASRRNQPIDTVMDTFFDIEERDEIEIQAIPKERLT